ncbi:MAG: ABC transporter substrate-binding protein [Gammaproteobacteria bacterium]|jgi:tripartite-type tricarboxylate transporter receptor subunit TctC|nr:ABC transporter substrate-binding protein [Gammaproteobacteria bacterium]MBU0786407.1 ABC transporter substrate-binding protein [Gammaproteobacteria bacterium]MBU0813593.1 ABC transporter substrate-binding protein [Gammaproteobacteria bacterium]MBU1788936.1 ABC transporter substrate-binding protein [Gammaproteobacteria bacterium]
MHKRVLIHACLLALLGLCSSLSSAQTGPIKMVVGYPPGATSDALARVVADAMSKRLNQPVVVENRAGAGGMIANQVVKAATPDGATLLMTPVATMSIFPHSYEGKLKYDPFKDFVPVTHLSNFQIGLGVGTHVPANTLKEYVAWVKSNPKDNGFYGSAANGSLPHFFGVMFAKSAGISLQHVAYRGTAPSMQALAGGEIAALSTVAADIQALVDANKARLLAVAGEKRSPKFPNVPTFREQGYDLVASPWYALFTTAGTPPAVVQRLAKAAMESIEDPVVQKRLLDMGLEPTGYGPEQLAEIMKADYARWGPPIRESGFKSE